MTGDGVSTLSASESTPAFETSSYLRIVENDHPYRRPYTVRGYPFPVTLSTKQSASGGFMIGSVLISYDITSLTLAPAPPPATLLATLLTDVTGVGTGETLEDLVEQAQSAYAADDIPAACHVVVRFLHEVRAQNGTTIAPTLDLSLTRQGQAIAAMIGCKE